MTDDDYEIYEAECAKIKKQNSKLLNEFASWLKQEKLTRTTINRHRQNVDFYINEFLLYEDAVEAQDGVSEIGFFLGYWFIKKALWSSPASIKSNAASLKKFYTFMYEKQFVEKEQLEDLKTDIKEKLPEWIATLERYDDDSIEDMEDVWQL